MTEKRFKAWAVLRAGCLSWVGTEWGPDIFMTKESAEEYADKTSGERVVPVEIVIKEGK